MPTRYPSRWRAPAAETIEARLADGRAAGLTGRALARHVAAGYPFGARKNHPYRIWLHEFEARVRGVLLPFTSRARAARRARSAGQGWLFDVTRSGTGDEAGQGGEGEPCR